MGNIDIEKDRPSAVPAWVKEKFSRDYNGETAWNKTQTGLPTLVTAARSCDTWQVNGLRSFVIDARLWISVASEVLSCVKNKTENGICLGSDLDLTFQLDRWAGCLSEFFQDAVNQEKPVPDRTRFDQVGLESFFIVWEALSIWDEGKKT